MVEKSLETLGSQEMVSFVYYANTRKRQETVGQSLLTATVTPTVVNVEDAAPRDGASQILDARKSRNTSLVSS